MKEELKNYIALLIYDLTQNDTQLILLAVLVVATVIVIDAITMTAWRKRQETGMDAEHSTVGIDGSEALKPREYISERQLLAGKPDAVILENGFVIPVERKPLARKIRDRYVAQLLVYMRLIEEFEGKKPPHGYLILGQNCRRVKIDNTPERQRWLQRYLDEMQGILNGQAESRPAPQVKKCAQCDVAEFCRARAVAPQVHSKSESLKKAAP